MFVRSRRSGRRLHFSLVETARNAGRVKSEHVGSLGSVPLPPSPADRIAFWAALHRRLASLGNRVGPEMHGKILGAVHAVVPMPTIDEQRAAQKEAAETDLRFWDAMHAVNAGMADGNNGLAAAATRKAEEAAAAAADAAQHRDAARDRLAKIERGEAAPGGPGMTQKDLAKMAERLLGRAELRRARMLAEMGEAIIPELVEEQVKRARRVEAPVIDAFYRRHQQRSKG